MAWIVSRLLPVLFAVLAFITGVAFVEQTDFDNWSNWTNWTGEFSGSGFLPEENASSSTASVPTASSSQTSTPKSSSSSDNTAGMIAGIVVGLSWISIVAGIVAWALYRKRRQAQRTVIENQMIMQRLVGGVV